MSNKQLTVKTGLQNWGTQYDISETLNLNFLQYFADAFHVQKHIPYESGKHA